MAARINGNGVGTMTMNASKQTTPQRSVKPVPTVEPKVAAPSGQDCGCCGPAGGCGTPTSDQIAAKAYALWEQRGGDATENWLEAERTLARNQA